MKKLFLSLISLCAALSLGAQSLPSLLVETDPASLGMAGATVAASSLYGSLEKNIAAVALQDHHLSAGVSYNRWQPSAAADNVVGFGLTGRIGGRLGLGFSGKLFMQPSYQIYNENGVASQINGTFAPKDLSFGIGAAYRIIDGLSVGAMARLTTSALSPEAKATVFGVDISAKYAQGPVQAGLTVANLGTKAKYGSSAYAQPLKVSAGAAYTIVGLTAALEADYVLNAGLMAALGLEYNFRDIAFARAGFHYGNAAKAIPMYASVGLGARFFGVSLDVSYLFASKTLGNTLCFGLGYRF